MFCKEERMRCISHLQLRAQVRILICVYLDDTDVITKLIIYLQQMHTCKSGRT